MTVKTLDATKRYNIINISLLFYLSFITHKHVLGWKYCEGPTNKIHTGSGPAAPMERRGEYGYPIIVLKDRPSQVLTSNRLKNTLSYIGPFPPFLPARL